MMQHVSVSLLQQRDCFCLIGMHVCLHVCDVLMWDGTVWECTCVGEWSLGVALCVCVYVTV